MSVSLKEKVKKYIKANYGKCSIKEVAHKFNVSQNAVEEYIIDELYVEEEQEKKPPPETAMPSDPLKWINRALIVLILVAIAILIVSLTVSQLSNNDLWQHLKNGQMILQTRMKMRTMISWLMLLNIGKTQILRTMIQMGMDVPMDGSIAIVWIPS